jgi:tetratricopeptide (TPR) repeat protein
LAASSSQVTPSYVGRERDLATLTSLLQTTARGRGSLVLLAGEPGIGKTRTCEELVRSAQQLGMDALWGRCWEAGGAPAYWPWMQVLETLLESVPAELSRSWLGTCAATIAPLLPEAWKEPSVGAPAGDSPSGRFEVFRCVASVLERAGRTRPILLLLDDVHGADEPSLLLLEFFARRLAEMPIMVVAAYRDVALAAESPLSTRLPDLLRQPVVRSLTVRRLDMVEVEELARNVTAQSLSLNVCLTLHRLTDGNPLFLLECLRAFQLENNLQGLNEGRLPLPLGLRNAISRHLAPLSSDCRAILRAAAVLGREFAIVTLRRLIHYPDDLLLTGILAEAVATEVLVADPASPGRYRFAHGLVHEALYAELNAIEQLRYHHDAATILSSLPLRDPNPAQIAHHFVEAARRGADPEPAVSAARAAGDRALARFAHDEAERLYTLALDVLEQFGPDDLRLHAELFLAHGRACNRLGEVERAKRSFERANELAQTLGLRDVISEATLEYGGPLEFPEGGYVDHTYVAMLEQALSRWSTDDHPLHARLLARLATTLYFADAVERRRHLCRRALEMVRAGDDAHALGRVLLATHTALWGPNPEERLQIADELVDLVRRTGNRTLGFSAHHCRYADLLELGDIARMENELQACRALANELQEPLMQGWMQIFQAGRAMWEGRFAECEQLASQTLGLSRWLGNAAQTMHFLQIFHLRALQGRCDEMLEPMRMVAGLNPGIPAFTIGLAYVHVEAGRLEEARPLAQSIATQPDSYPLDINFISTLSCLGLVCARLGDPTLTQTIYERLKPYGELSIMIGNGIGYCGAAAHWLGVMATSLGRYDEAAAHFERALTTETAMGSPPWIANTQYEYALMLRARSHPADEARAMALAERAAITAKELGMNGLLEKAQAFHAATPQTPTGFWAGDELRRGGATVAENGASLFRREGDFWTIEHDSHTVRLRDSRGLRYVAQLLQHPRREFLALELAADSAEVANQQKAAMAELGCAKENRGEPVSDRRAIAAYRERLDVLRSELAETEQNHDLGRAAALREEIEVLVQQLTVDVGLNGRTRGMSSNLERARSAVSKRIREALRRIEVENPSLGQYLSRSIQTGYFCAYDPPVHDQIHWAF